jgi:glycosyltransferase involved in cell wall biosynthesis
MVSYGFLSPYPPTKCGLATFSVALLHHLEDPAADERCGVVHVVDDALSEREPGDTAVRLVNGRPVSALRAVDALNQFDVLIVQHEFDVYGGPDGEDVLDVLATVERPVITVLHTVLAAPAPHKRQVLQRIIDASGAVVVLSRAAALTLIDSYRIDANRVSIIPQGAVTPGTAQPGPHHAGPPTVLTWGLIGPGKGIEWAIAALGQLRDLRPIPRYLIAGRTHPKVLAAQGESYRAYLRRQARRFGVADLVEFDPSYRTATALTALLRQVDMVLLPYDSTVKVSSGVLVEAVAAGRPVIATGFPQARELLAGGAGLVVPHRDPWAMAHAIRRVLTEPGLAAQMADRCASLAPGFDWNTIADSYRSLARALIAAHAENRVAT